MTTDIEKNQSKGIKLCTQSNINSKTVVANA